MHSLAVGQRSLEPPVGNVGVWCNQAQPECVVQCSGVGAEKGRQPMVLHQLSLPKCSHEEGLLPSA